MGNMCPLLVRGFGSSAVKGRFLWPCRGRVIAPCLCPCLLGTTFILLLTNSKHIESICLNKVAYTMYIVCLEVFCDGKNWLLF